MTDELELEPPDEGFWARLAGELLSPGGLPDNSTSLALEASRIVKVGAGRLWGFTGLSNRGTAQFVLAFDTDKLPADGAIPVLVIAAAANSNFFWDGGTRGRAFHRGLVLTNSSTLATKTIGAADCWFDAQYD